MTERQIFPYRIPDRFFLPHKVISPFMAKVIYTIHKGQVKIEEVGLSPKCLKYINNTADMITNIEGELMAVMLKHKGLNKINETIARAIAPHI
ncbi:MAG: hypothetical protein V4577_26420 [Bacteroidota bacterium]